MRADRTKLLMATAAIVVAAMVWHPWADPDAGGDGLAPIPGRAIAARSGAAPALEAASPQGNGGDTEDGSSKADIPASPFLRGVVTAIEGLQGEPDPVRKRERLEAFALGVAKNDLPWAVSFLWDRDLSADGRQLRLRLLERWAGSSPEAASKWVMEQEPNAVRSEAMGALATAWVQVDPTAALRWARGLPEGSDQHDSLVAIAYETARTAPFEAMKLAVQMGGSEAGEDLLAHVTRQWAVLEPRTAADWVAQIADPDLRERLLGHVVVTWGEQNAVEAAEFALKSTQSGVGQDDIVVGIVQRWVQQEPAEAARWVEQFPAGALRDTSLEAVVQLWSDQDADQAGRWLNSLPEGPVRDTSAAAYARQLAPLAPVLAAQWADSIADEGVRLGALEAVGETWLGVDAEAARNWIERSRLPDPARARVLALKP